MPSQNSSLVKAVRNIRELFWPLLESDSGDKDAEEARTLDVALPKLKINDPKNLQRAFELISEIIEGEDDRRKSIESKASLFLSTITVASSIVVAANVLLTTNAIYSIHIKISVFISFLLALYSVRTVWFSVSALERGTYHVLDFNDINLAGTEDEYVQQMILLCKKKTEQNQSAINDKVNNLALAQAYYKRAIVTICAYAFLILGFSLFSPNKAKTAIDPNSSDLKPKANEYSGNKIPRSNADTAAHKISTGSFSRKDSNAVPSRSK